MTGVRRIARWVRRRRAVRRRFNPYVVGTSVFDSALLFGRARLTGGIIRLLSSRNVKLTGERRIGKTTFLHNLHRALVSGDGALGRCSQPVSGAGFLADPSAHKHTDSPFLQHGQ